jgi:flagellar protein FlgJ
MNALTPAGVAYASPASIPGDDLFTIRNQQPEELAKEFESVFVSMLVKQLRQTAGQDSGLFPGDNSDTFGGMFDMYLGRHIAQSGGIGLAESISAAIQKQTGA